MRERERNIVFKHNNQISLAQIVFVFVRRMKKAEKIIAKHFSRHVGLEGLLLA